MAIFKCKMCGGSLEINNETVATCEYCGTQQTLPKLGDERKANLYDRANHFRRNNDYDKAMSIYEQILDNDQTDAEAYWSLVLCRFGIEYVEDPVSKKRIPTVNRTQNTAIFDDVNYKAALEHADALQRGVYEAEAYAINEIQKRILEISLKENPFDVFICYKETDETGKRTPDSVLANDLYHQLTREGYKVFFARITLENKLGSAYEPYIFAALNSAKVMIVLGTKPEYFNAAWVKNEWSRYLALIKNGADKMLIPAYRDMDPYDLPEEFAHLQSQDMSRLGCVQDIIHGIKKIVVKEEPATVRQVEVVTAPATATVSVQSLLERVAMFIEDENWDEADLYCEKVLDIDPKNGKAYTYKLLAECNATSVEKLKYNRESFENSNNYQKALRFCDEITADNIKAVARANVDYRAAISRNKAYRDAYQKLERATTKSECVLAKQMFINLGSFADAPQKAEECDAKIKQLEQAAEDRRKDEIYNSAKSAMMTNKIDGYNRAIMSLKTIPGWKDSDALVNFCEDKIDELNTKKDERKKKGKKVRRGCLISIIAVIVAILLFLFVGLPAILSGVGDSYADSGDYINAESAYGIAGGLGNKKASEKCLESVSILVEKSIENGKYYETYDMLSKYADNSGLLTNISMQDYLAERTDKYYAEGNYLMAALLYAAEGNNAEKIEDCQHKMVENAKKGDIICFGRTEQETNMDGEELVLWKVADIVDGDLMLVSVMALDQQSFGDSKSSWSTSDVRKKLNNTFYNETFSEKEKEYIVRSKVVSDKIYLLSKDENMKYLSSTERKAFIIDSVAQQQFLYDSNTYYTGTCWTRNPGVVVDTDGEIEENVTKTSMNYVRPVMWIAP